MENKPTKSLNRKSGRLGEKLALKFLKKEKRYIILDKNYSTNLGELDIIASDKGTIVFVEVKAGAVQDFGTPLERVTESKQRKIAQVACQWLARFQIREADCRFDVVEVNFSDNNRIEHIENAFDSPL